MLVVAVVAVMQQVVVLAAAVLAETEAFRYLVPLDKMVLLLQLILVVGAVVPVQQARQLLQQVVMVRLVL